MKTIHHRFLGILLLMMTTIVTSRAWTGSGTSSDPYLINNTTDWQTLAANVNAGESYSGKVFRMTQDIDANGAIVGCFEDMVLHPFSGTFDGDGHMLTFYAGTFDSPVNDTTAPFGYVSGATIRHLRTTGEIYTRDWFTAGIVARILGPGATQLYDCHSSMRIYTRQGGNMYNGGMVGNVTSWASNLSVDSVQIDRCSFTGALINSGTSASTDCGGFVGSIEDNIPLTIRDCVFDPQGWTYHDVVMDGCTFANVTSTKNLKLERCYTTMQMKTRQGTFILNKMIVPEGVTYEFQGEPDVTLDGKEYWTNGCWVQLNVPSGTTFNHWYDNNRCFISDPFTANGLHQLKDLSQEPLLSIITKDIPEAETERTLWGVTYRYLSRKDYHFYISDEDLEAMGWKFENDDNDANLIVYNANGDASEITAIVDYYEPDYNSDGVQIHNDLVSNIPARNHTHLGLIAPHAFRDSKKLESLYFKDTDSNSSARTSFKFFIGTGAFDGCTKFRELKMMQYTTEGTNHWEALTPDQVVSVADDAFTGCTNLRISAQADKYQDYMASDTWKAHRRRFIIYEATTEDFNVEGVLYHWFRSFDQKTDLKNDDDGKKQMMDQIRTWNADYLQFSVASLLDTKDDCNVYYTSIIGVNDSDIDGKDGVMRIYNDPGSYYNYKNIVLQRDAIAGNTHVKHIEFYQTNGNGDNSYSDLKMVIPNGAFKNCTNLKELRMFYYVEDGEDHWTALGPTDVIPGDNIFGLPTNEEMKDLTSEERDAIRKKHKDFRVLVATDLYPDFLEDPNWMPYIKYIYPVEFAPNAQTDYTKDGLTYTYMTSPAGIAQTSQVVSQDVSWWTAPRITVEVLMMLGSILGGGGNTINQVMTAEEAQAEFWEIARYEANFMNGDEMDAAIQFINSRFAREGIFTYGTEDMFEQALEQGWINNVGNVLLNEASFRALSEESKNDFIALISDVIQNYQAEIHTIRTRLAQGLSVAAQVRSIEIIKRGAQGTLPVQPSTMRKILGLLPMVAAKVASHTLQSLHIWGGSGSYNTELMNKGMRENILSNIHQVGMVGGGYVITTPQKNLIYHTYIKNVDNATTNAVIYAGFDNDNNVNTSNRTMTFARDAFKNKKNLKTVKFHEISGQTSNTGMPLLFTLPDSAFVGCTKLTTFSTLLQTDENGTRALGPENFILAGDSIFVGQKSQAEIDSLAAAGEDTDGLVAFSIVIDPSRKQDFLDNATWKPLEKFFKYESAKPEAKYNEYGAKYAYAYENNSIKKEHKAEGHLIEHTVVTGPDDDFITGHQGAVKLCNDIGVYNNYQLDEVMPKAFKDNKNLRSVSFVDLYGFTVFGDSYTDLQVHIGDSAFMGCTNLADLDLLYMVTDGINRLDPITPQMLTIGKGVFDGTNARLKMMPQQLAWFEADSAWAQYKDRFMPCVVRFGDEGVTAGLRDAMLEMAYYDPANTGTDQAKWNDYIDYARIAGAGFSWLDGKFTQNKDKIYSFSDFKWFESVGLDYVGPSWFEDCSKLSNITLPSTIKYIRQKAFKGCTSLKEIELPMGVSSIQNEAFGGCTSLNTIVVRDSMPAQLGSGVFHKHDGLKIYVPAPRVSTYKNLWQEYAQYIVGDTDYKVNKVVTVTAVGQLASKLGLTVTKSFSKVEFVNGPYAKYDSLTIIGPLNGEDLGVIRHLAGADAYDSEPTDGQLRYLNLWDARIKEDSENSYNGNGVDEKIDKDDIVPDYLFENCKAIETVIFPKAATEIGENIFEDASSLKRVCVGRNTIKYGTDILQYLNGIDELVLLTKDHATDDSFFKDPWEAPIQQVWTLSSTLGDYMGDLGLTRQAQAMNAPFVEDDVMWSLANKGHFFPSEYLGLESVEGIFHTNAIIHFDDFQKFYNVKKLQDTFHSAFGLQSITLPYSIEEIGAGAFSGCTALETIHISCDSVPMLENDAFKDLPADFRILVPKSLCKLYRSKWPQYADHINPDDTSDGNGIITITVTEPNTVAKKLGLTAGLSDVSLVWSGKWVNSLRGDYSKIRGLKIIGPISGGDLDVLRCLAGFTPWANTRNYSGHLEYIDLYDAQLVNSDVHVRGRYKNLHVMHLGEEKDDNYEVEDNVLPHHAFLRAYNLKTLILPRTCKKVDERAMQECEGLETIVIGDDMEDFNWNALDDDAMLTRMYILAKKKVNISTQNALWRALCNNYNPTFDAFYVRPSLYNEYIADDAYVGSSWQRTNNISTGAFDEDESFAAFAAHAAAATDDLFGVYSVNGWFDHHTGVKDLTQLGYTAVDSLRAADMQKLTKLEKIILPITMEVIEDSVFSRSPNLRYVDMLMCDSTMIVDDIKKRGLATLGIDSLQTLTYLPKEYGVPSGTNIVVANNEDLSAETFRLIDGKDYCVPYAFHANAIQNSRTLTNSGVKYTVCLPYNMPVPLGAKAYTLTGREGNTLIFTEVMDSLRAFEPYLVVIGSNAVSLTTDVAQTIPTSIGAFGHQVEGVGYVMRGTLSTISNAMAAETGAYILQSDDLWHPVTDGNANAYIPSFRAYLLQSGSSGGAKALGMQFIDGDPTDIRLMKNGESSLVNDGAWYTLDGRKISVFSGTSKPSQLPKGIYIHNGRKVVIK